MKTGTSASLGRTLRVISIIAIALVLVIGTFTLPVGAQPVTQGGTTTPNGAPPSATSTKAPPSATSTKAPPSATSTTGAPTVTTTPACIAKHDLEGLLVTPNHGTVTNTSSTCSYGVGIASYTRTGGGGLTSQVLFDSSTATVGPNQMVDLFVNLPPCQWQVDLFIGQPIQSFTGGDKYGGRLLDYKVGGTACTAPTSTATNTVTAPTTTATATSTRSPATETSTATATVQGTTPTETVTGATPTNTTVPPVVNSTPTNTTVPPVPSNTPANTKVPPSCCAPGPTNTNTPTAGPSVTGTRVPIFPTIGSTPVVPGQPTNTPPSVQPTSIPPSGQPTSIPPSVQPTVAPPAPTQPQAVLPGNSQRPPTQPQAVLPGSGQRPLVTVAQPSNQVVLPASGARPPAMPNTGASDQQQAVTLLLVLVATAALACGLVLRRRGRER